MYLSIYIHLALCYVTNILCNDSPIIGILTQETYLSNLNSFKSSNSYIAASYVKSIEASGGRVIPVFTNKTTKYYAYVK